MYLRTLVFLTKDLRPLGCRRETEARTDSGMLCRFGASVRAFVLHLLPEQDNVLQRTLARRKAGTGRRLPESLTAVTRCEPQREQRDSAASFQHGHPKWLPPEARPPPHLGPAATASCAVLPSPPCSCRPLRGGWGVARICDGFARSESLGVPGLCPLSC